MLQVFIIFISANVSADNSESEKSKSNYKWFVSIYGGPHTDENLAEIAGLNATYSDDNYVAVGALASISLGQIYRHQLRYRWRTVIF